MDRKYRWEQLYDALRSLPEDKRTQFIDAREDDAEYNLLLSRLLSELEMLKGEGAKNQSEASGHTKKSGPTKKMIPSATKKTENKIIEAILSKLKDKDFIIDCFFKVMFAMALAFPVVMIKTTNKWGAELSKAFDEAFEKVTGIADGDQSESSDE